MQFIKTFFALSLAALAFAAPSAHPRQNNAAAQPGLLDGLPVVGPIVQALGPTIEAVPVVGPILGDISHGIDILFDSALNWY
ncbi:hypothetical protein B0F90DRAFT_1825082 [Multifurca ochricompacta]|uniref:Hydrophobin n=1 Tax=Multifurca ochricompacta TaxID=376703 RepID=A0AAD4LTP1_9AGAM|nr:hypothetical protein B0F90DRAFT_1825082 [Multifurca ochricompacta]